MVVESVELKPAAPGGNDAVVARSVDTLRFLFGACHEPAFAVRLWDGSVWTPSPERAPQFTLVLRHAGALRTMFVPPTLQNVGEAFIRGDWDVEGASGHVLW